MYAGEFDHEEFTYFFSKNRIINLGVSNETQKLPQHIYQTLRYYDTKTIIDLE